MSTTQTTAYKILLVGEGGVGKTAFIKRCKKNYFEQAYKPTLGAHVSPIISGSGSSDETFHMWDIAGQIIAPGDHLYAKADAAIIMYDVTSKLTFKSLQKWRSRIEKTCGDIPIITLGNKVDCEKTPAVVRRRMSENADEIREFHLPHYDISVKDDYNLDKPFLELRRMLLNED